MAGWGYGRRKTRPTGRGLIPLIWILYFLVLRKFLFLWFCGVSKRFLYFWLSDAVTDRKPTRHRPTRTCAGLPIQKLKKFRVKHIFPSSRKKSNSQKFWNSKKAKISIFLNPGEFRKFWFFEKISVLFGAFFHDPWGPAGQWRFVPSGRGQMAHAFSLAHYMTKLIFMCRFPRSEPD